MNNTQFVANSEENQAAGHSSSSFLARTADIGLGTTFERFALYRWLAHIAARYAVQTVLEGPGDGVAGIRGINSLALGQQGRQVTVALTDEAEMPLARRVWSEQDVPAEVMCVQGAELPFPDQAFDLVWNFNCLPFADARPLIAEMVRVSRRYVALVVPNRRNYGFPARRLYHWRTREPWTYGDTSIMHPRVVRGLLREAGLRTLETRWIDVPWWPDIIDPVAWLRAMVPGANRLLPSSRGEEGYRWEADALPYFDAATYADVHRRMARLSWMEERLPAPLQMPFAHHFGVLAIKEEASHA